MIAKVDLEKVSFLKENRVGIDFFNEIDVWAKMEFRFRGQISQLRQNKTLSTNSTVLGTHPLPYSVREKLD
ncbi:MAG: hypothetical protein V4598_16470 [Bdellovibrionota bacterium]